MAISRGAPRFGDLEAILMVPPRREWVLDSVQMQRTKADTKSAWLQRFDWEAVGSNSRLLRTHYFAPDARG